jgi:hypothetical protein
MSELKNQIQKFQMTSDEKITKIIVVDLEKL